MNPSPNPNPNPNPNPYPSPSPNQAATVTRDELRAALRAELARREERGEPCTPVHVLDSEARAADRAADLAAEFAAGSPPR